MFLRGKEMSKEKKLKIRIIAVFLIALGVVLGATWNRTRFCIGDNLFHALGLPAWSNGATGAHYPAIAGSAVIIGGISAINYTLQKKERHLVWTIVLIFFVALKIIASYI